MKKVSKDFRNGYILALDSCLKEGFILNQEKKLLIQAFDSMYEVSQVVDSVSDKVDFSKHD